MTDANELLRVLWLFVPAYLANMAPVLVQGHWTRLATPIDGGRTWRGTRLLGDHKTWRGLVAGLAAGVLAWEAQRAIHALGWLGGFACLDYAAHPVVPGLLLGLGAIAGDAVKSFWKRRVGIAPGASWPVFDQLDFMLGAWLLITPVVVPPLGAMVAALPIVLAGSMVTTAIGYGLGLKEAWI